MGTKARAKKLAPSPLPPQDRRVRRRKGEVITLYCSQCTWSTELPMADTESSQVIPCSHCKALLYWHRCARCDLRYAGAAEPRCPICDDPGDGDLTLD
jgi:NAD-dependent SIR2 family protein deacetylase